MLARNAFLALGSCVFLLAGCGSTPSVQLAVSSDPVGAQVFLSRRGEKSYRADLGPLEGDMKSKELVEDFFFLGTSPLEYTTPLEENESDARVLGFGGAVVLEYHEGLLRFEKEGYETVERRVRFVKGKVELHVTMPEGAEDVARADDARP